MRTKLKDRLLPSYTKGEEIFNMVSHIVGGGLGIAATALLVVFAALRSNAYGIVSVAIFGATMIILYTMSSIYHGLRPNLAKKVFQIIDHCAIYLLIAGTYTPFSLCTLREYNTALGWTVFGIIWGLAALGITLNAIDLKSFKVISMVLYIGMGWCIVFTGKIIFNMLGTGGFSFLLAGGISYTIGAILYGFGRKVKYFHSVFHLFVVTGSILHSLCILFFVIL
ncbi:MAG: hemolysin III family protein [Acutalibacteraceae bacterium]|nr:hemolysin III family protein [Acutalibacteraceae bacterium]